MAPALTAVRLRALPLAGVATGLGVSAVATVATWSVVQYRLPIVVAYSIACAALIAVQVRRVPLGLGTVGAASALFATSVATVAVPFFSYVAEPAREGIRWGLAATALGAAVLMVLRRPLVALACAAMGFAGSSVAVILLDPAPRIDVWVTLQQAGDALARGESPYTQTWVGSPGMQDAFTYLPMTAVLTAPFRWVFGDVRWGVALALAVAAACVVVLAGRRRREAGAPAAAVLLLLPGTATMVEQAWTEPLLLACLLIAAVAWQRGWWRAAAVALAIGLASKQHLVLALPVLAAWPQVGLRRAVVAGAGAAALVLPWFLAAPGAFLHDTVTVLIGFRPLEFADTLYIAAVNELGWLPPFWTTGLVVAGTVAAVAVAVRRRDVSLPELLRWLALVLLVANLVNKQAFYNQYWLCLGLVVASLTGWPAARAASTSRSPTATPAPPTPGRALPTRPAGRRPAAAR